MGTIHWERISPPPILADTIECFWRLLSPRVVAPDEIILAEYRDEILFQFRGQSQILSRDGGLPFNCASSWLMHPYAHARHVRQIGVSSSAMIGVRFTPGGWATIQHSDTTDKQPYSFMPLNDFYAPNDVRLLEEQLFYALHTPQWACPLVSFFVQRKVERSHYDRIICTTRQLERQQLTVSAPVQEVNLSERQFGRVFRQIVGLSPKQFSRIARLNRVLNSPIHHVYGMTMEQIAVRHGFHDAPHLVREFRELVDTTPLDLTLSVCP